MPGPDFTGLSDEEVRAMEGTERRHVEARIQCLRNIQTLLDAAVVQMQQYSSLVHSLDVNGPRPFRMDSTTVTTSTRTTPSPSEGHGGAKPKTSQQRPEVVPEAKVQEDEDVKGAVGGLPRVETIPEWNDPREEVVEDSELNEIRRRRLEKLDSKNNTMEKTTEEQ